MSARVRSVRTRTEPTSPPALQLSSTVAQVPRWQQLWWVIGLLVSVVGVLGFQATSPSRRLASLERVVARADTANVRQDSTFATHARAERVLLDSIQRRLDQLLAGQCVKERDRMARVVYGCVER